MLIVHAYDHDGFYIGPMELNESDKSPLEPDVYIEPANTARAAPPAVTGGRVQRWVDGVWELVNPNTVDPMPMPEIEAIRLDVFKALAAQYERRARVISDSYPPTERESWPVQIIESRDLLAYLAREDLEAPVPTTLWIDAAAAARGMSSSELATRIVAKDEAYRCVHGAFTGARQRKEDEIAALDTIEELQSYDVALGWP